MQKKITEVFHKLLELISKHHFNKMLKLVQHDFKHTLKSVKKYQFTIIAVYDPSAN